MSDLTLRQAQKWIDEWVQTQGGYWSSLSIVAQLAEETGEIARLINHLCGDKPKKAAESPQELGVELCDLLYALICLANRHNIDLQENLEAVMSKYQTRDDGRFLKPTNATREQEG